MFAQDEGGEGLVGYADVQVNLKDINDNAPIFPQGVYFGNVTENGTAGNIFTYNIQHSRVVCYCSLALIIHDLFYQVPDFNAILLIHQS